MDDAERRWPCSRQQATITINKMIPTTNNNKYRNSTLFLEQKRLAVQKNLQQLHESSLTRETIRSKTSTRSTSLILIVNVHSDLRAQNSKHESNSLKRYHTAAPVLNDRLRKRRCFADKELDNIPALTSTVEHIASNSAFRLISAARFRSHDCQENARTTRISAPKKWTDFSVAAIIGQS